LLARRDLPNNSPSRTFVEQRDASTLNIVSFDSPNVYLVKETCFLIDDLLPGTSKVVTLNVTPLQEGGLCIRDLFLVETGTRVTRRLSCAYEILAVK
jgi:hypothetical protein